MSNDMNRELLETCSESVQSAIEYLNSELDEIGEYGPEYAPVFYLLDKVESDTVQQFVDSWNKQEFSLFDMIMSYPLSTTYLFKLEQKYNPKTWREQSEIQDLAEYLKSEQRVSGQIRTNEIRHSAPLWALLQYEPNSVATQNAVDYLKLGVDSEDWSNSFQGVQRLAVGALVLCEDDFNEHKESLQSISKQLENNIDEFIKSRLNDDEYPRYEEAACDLMALHRLPRDHTQMIQRIVGNLQNSQEKDGYWFEERFVRESATIALGLVSAGGGPRIPAHEVEWQRTLDEQARRRSRPQFASTFPAKAGATSATGIYNKSKLLNLSFFTWKKCKSLFM